MKATLRNVDTCRLRAAFAGDISEFIRDNSDVGYYYSPNVEIGIRSFVSSADRELHTVQFLRVEFPNSTLSLIGETIVVDGRRGSVADCLAPILREAGIDLDSRQWEVETTRPDVAWYRRTADELVSA